MIQETAYERRLPLEGCGNFRDLGGYEAADGRSVRWRRLFRSDALTWLTPEDLATLSAYGLELTAGFDLRTPQELAVMEPGILFENGARHHHLPFVPSFGDDPEKIRTLAFATGEVAGVEYVSLMEQSHACFAGLFAALADEENYPAAFYCAAGKDRTGMISAVLLRALGVSDEQIIEDYALSGPPDIDRLRSRMQALGRVFDEKIDRTKLAAQPDTMVHFLRVFDSRYISVEAFLAGCGVSSGVIERVREHLLEA
ncbi:MAG TPA: tyrosine-protein phosphatase [Dehalococcoidia bacterium]|jgi:protein-tyrosine phosphatase